MSVGRLEGSSPDWCITSNYINFACIIASFLHFSSGQQIVKNIDPNYCLQSGQEDSHHEAGDWDINLLALIVSEVSGLDLPMMAEWVWQMALITRTPVRDGGERTGEGRAGKCLVM